MPSFTRNVSCYRFHTAYVWANTKNKAAIIRSWNGASACVDLSNTNTQKWFKERLDHLVNEYDADGLQFDAGDAGFYTNDVFSFNAKIPNNHTASLLNWACTIL